MVKYFQKLRKTETLLRASMHTVDFYVFSLLFLGLIFRVRVCVSFGSGAVGEAVSCYSPDWSGTHYAAQISLKFAESLLSQHST